MKKRFLIACLGLMFLTGCGDTEVSIDDLGVVDSGESTTMSYAEYMGRTKEDVFSPDDHTAVIEDSDNLYQDVVDTNKEDDCDVCDADNLLDDADDDLAEDGVVLDDLILEEDYDDLSYTITLDEDAARKAAVNQNGFYSEDGKLHFDTVIVTASNGERVIFGSYEDLFTDCDSVHINSEGNPGSTGYTNLIAELKTIDKRLVKYFVNSHGQFYLSDEGTFSKIRDTEDTAAFTRGYYTDDDAYSYASIHCYDGDAEYFKFVLTHELGHGLAFNAYDSTGKRIVYSELWESIYDEEFLDSGMDEYYMTNSAEYFAGCVEYYYLNPSSFKDRCPRSYYYVDTIISSLPY